MQRHSMTVCDAVMCLARTKVSVDASQVLQIFGLLFQMDAGTGVHCVCQKRLLRRSGGRTQGENLDSVSLSDVLLSVNSIAGNVQSHMQAQE